MKSIAFVTTWFAAFSFLASVAALAQSTPIGPGSSIPSRPNAPITGQQDTSTTGPEREPQTKQQRTGTDPTGQSTVSDSTASARHGMRGAHGQRITFESKDGTVHRP